MQAASTDPTVGGWPTETGQLVGTVGYMSPEQARGLTVNAASDVFSFGIVFYELLTGVHPFKAETAVDTLNAILTKDPVRVTVHRPSLSQEIDETVARALQKEASHRFPSGVELLDELRRQTTRQVVRGKPEPGVQPKSRWMRAAGTVLIVALLFLAGWFFLRAPTPSAATPVRSVALMTFRTASDDPRASALAEGLLEELGAALSRTGLHVVAAVCCSWSGLRIRAVSAGNSASTPFWRVACAAMAAD